MRALKLVLRHTYFRQRNEPGTTVEAITTKKTGMEKLPNELLVMIIKRLDPPSAVCLALASRRIYHCVLHYTRCRRLDDICPKNYYQQTPRRLRLFYHSRKLPHYRNPGKVMDYAAEYGISRRHYNPAYIQLLLCLRSFMAPKYVFCFASATVRYVPRKGRHVCGACQSERRYLAEKELHEFSSEVVRQWKACPYRQAVELLGRMLRFLRVKD